MGPSVVVKLSGMGVNQTKVIASSAYIGSCALTKDLVAALLGVDAEPAEVAELFAAHECVAHFVVLVKREVGPTEAFY